MNYRRCSLAILSGRILLFQRNAQVCLPRNGIFRRNIATKWLAMPLGVLIGLLSPW
jgi:hypothetical protein